MIQELNRNNKEMKIENNGKIKKILIEFWYEPEKDILTLKEVSQVEDFCE